MHVFTLTDLTTTISLSASGVIVTRYDIRPGDARAADMLLGTDGGELTRPQWTNVTESIDILISDTTTQAVRDKGNAIERMLGQARDSRRLMGTARVFVTAQISGEADAYRSEILHGQLVWQDAIDGAPKLKAQASIIITRRYYWEGPEVQVSLTSPTTTTQTVDPVVIYNESGATAQNVFQANASQANKAGQLPSPLKIKLINQAGVGVQIRNIYLSNHTFIGTISPFLLGTNNTFAHGAVYTAAGSGNNNAYNWPIPDATLAAYAGRYARILVGVNATFDGYMQAGQRAGGDSAYRNEQVRGSGDFSRLIDLGAMPIPPGRNLPNPTATDLDLWVQKAGGLTVNLRYVQMTAAGDGVFRRLRNNAQIGAGDSVIDDGIENTYYGYVESTGKSVPLVSAYGSPIMLWPGRTNRIHMLYHTATGLGSNNQVGVQVWVRPRRLTI